LRTEAVSSIASRISGYPSVRAALLAGLIAALTAEI